jgi:NAD(P)-dependent dehydrogenase (short-subunit alcohol dehydrogenase family)
MSDASVVIVGGTSGLCLRLAETYAARGRNVVITGRRLDRTREVAASIPGTREVGACAFDLADPESIAGCLADVGAVDRLVIGAIERDENSVADYDIDRARYLITMKLIGYTEVVHTLLSRLARDSSILLFGGQALRRPYPGSTTVTTVNGGVVGMVHTLAVELAPMRVNGIHPGVIGDSPYWAAKPPEVLEALAARTPLGRLVTMDEITDAATFLLENGAVTGQNLEVDGGWLLR